MVGATGFEPATPCTPSKCATRLRYAPTRKAFADGREYTTALSSYNPSLPSMLPLRSLSMWRISRCTSSNRAARSTLPNFISI